MCMRTFNHLLQYSETPLKRAVPLAMGLLRIGNPADVNVMDILSKLAYDQDAGVS